MNKRIEKIVKKVRESKNNIATPRRDQVKKAIEEKAFDYIIYKGYDEIYDVEPIKMAAVLENIEDYWLRNGDMWASINKNCLKVTIKYGYSYMDLFVDLEEKNNENKLLKTHNMNIEFNEEKNGIEISFSIKPDKEILSKLKENGFRWHRVKKVWYAKQSEERINFINNLIYKENKEDELVNDNLLNNVIELNDYKKDIKENEEVKEGKMIINPKIIEIEENNQYFIKSAKFAKLNKNNTIEEYQEEVLKGDYYYNDIRITRELHFNSIEELESFNNSLLFDFDFIKGTGGSYTEDERINDIKDYWKMSKEEKETVKWYLKGIAVYFNNELQYVIDAQGYSYARYVGLVGEHTKNEKKIVKEIKEEKIEMEMNFDDILESFDNVEIENKNRLCDEDLSVMEDLQEKFNNVKEGFKKYIEFYRENKIYNLEEKEIKFSCDNLEEHFVNKIMFPECCSFISDVYCYFEKKYNVSLEKKYHDKDYNLDYRGERAKENLRWFMEELDYNLILDDIFNQLDGVNFRDKGIEQLKNQVVEKTKGWKKSNIDIKGKNLNLKDYLYFSSWGRDYGEYKIGYDNKIHIENLLKLVTIYKYKEIRNDIINDIVDSLQGWKDVTITKFEFEELKGIGIKFYKNGKVQLIFNSGIEALEFAQEYLNYKEVA
ncbi:hypothetical protein ACSW9O_15245 (plasmid) [Clostridium perfringens]|nr:hypothetical protein [Clostridium perfringens]